MVELRYCVTSLKPFGQVRNRQKKPMMIGQSYNGKSVAQLFNPKQIDLA